MPGSRSKSRYSTCLSPFGFTMGLLPPSAVMGALSFMFYISQERMLLLTEEEHWGSVTVKQTSDFRQSSIVTIPIICLLRLQEI